MNATSSTPASVSLTRSSVAVRCSAVTLSVMAGTALTATAMARTSPERSADRPTASRRRPAVCVRVLAAAARDRWGSSRAGRVTGNRIRRPSRTSASVEAPRRRWTMRCEFHRGRRDVFDRAGNFEPEMRRPPRPACRRGHYGRATTSGDAVRRSRISAAWSIILRPDRQFCRPGARAIARRVRSAGRRWRRPHVAGVAAVSCRARGPCRAGEKRAVAQATPNRLSGIRREPRTGFSSGRLRAKFSNARGQLHAAVGDSRGSCSSGRSGNRGGPDEVRDGPARRPPAGSRSAGRSSSGAPPTGRALVEAASTGTRSRLRSTSRARRSQASFSDRGRREGMRVEIHGGSAGRARPRS